jgi:glycosyltransferase involved in cell wall biosynthesis
MSLKVLVLSRSYPNNVMPVLGMWVERLVQHVAQHCVPRVVAPVPYCPPAPPFVGFTKYRRIVHCRQTEGVNVWHPRYLAGPGYWLHRFDATLYYLSVRRLVEKLHDDSPFDLIHAHFVYPDGVAAVRLGNELGIPVAITEHARWKPWMDLYPTVRVQAVAASRECALHMPVSRFVRDTIVQYTGKSANIHVVPIGVDGSVFTPGTDGSSPNSNQILFVGRIHRVKGVDILLRAMQSLISRRPASKLVLIGGGFLWRDFRRQDKQLRDMAAQLGLRSHVEFLGPKEPCEVAHLMRNSAVVVLPSRAETFGAVLIEALACGTPVVATRCGGPEEIVTDKLGVLVAPEDPDALSQAIQHVLDNRKSYDSRLLREHALNNYSWEKISQKTVDLYHQVVENHR